ncbi:DUF1998 domain-containing protein, partial [candidate division FCPU426 bacterium]|nr:DUF1998 domain-containing protein [candidate division FCPU426 bacterium]
LLSEHKLDLPPRVFETQAVLLTVPETWRRRALDYSLDFGGGLHAVEHSLIAALPVQVLCDRWDLGGLSTLAHPQVAAPCIFVYDGYPGGVGLATKGLELLADWIETAWEMVRTCECQDGCPACIHSPKCGSRNQPLDKQACQMILAAARQQTVKKLNLAKQGVFISARPGNRESPGRESPMVLPVADLPKKGGTPMHLLVFDLETKYSAADVGGWGYASRMGMSLGVVYDHTQEAFSTYREEATQQLIQHLLSADVVVGFNIDKFDLTVLSPYSPHVERVRTLDIISDVYQALGYRLSLNHLALHTLGREKTAEGLQAIAWYQQGRWEELESYCREDVAITRDLFFFGLQYGYLLYEKRGMILKIPVNWKGRFPDLKTPGKFAHPSAET